MEPETQQKKSNNNRIDIDDIEYLEERSLWNAGSKVLVYSRSNDKWYDGIIAEIFQDNENNEWLMVQYNKNKIKKTMQRNCKHLKSIPFNHPLALKKNSFCLIYSDLSKQWCKGKVVQIFNDNEGEWLKIKFLENNQIKMCDIQRYSKQLKPFPTHKKQKQKDKNGINTSKNIKPSLLQKKWNINKIKNNMKKMEDVMFHKNIKSITKIVKISKSFMNDTPKKGCIEPQIYMEERKKEIIIYLDRIINICKDNNNNNNYFNIDMKEQYIFDNFILDNKTKEGRIINQWLAFIYKKEQEIIFKDLLDFIQKLTHTFIHSYTLNSNLYYEYILILCYRCILCQNSIKRIVYNLLNINNINNININNIEVINMNESIKLDKIYDKKVMWMRALNKDQLGIGEDYWIKKIEFKQNNKHKRRLSQIGLMAGDDVAFAEAINLTGQLQINNKIIIKWESKLREKRQTQNNGNTPKKTHIWQQKINEIPFLTLNNHRKSNENMCNSDSNRSSIGSSIGSSNEERDEKNNEIDEEKEEMIPFILPLEGLNTLISATKCIESTAIKYFYEYHEDKKDEDDNSPCISQDILLPIIIYCVIQSKLETPNRLIYFIENILPKDTITMGQSAWALSQLKAAVKYILKAKPQMFGMDNEIELD